MSVILTIVAAIAVFCLLIVSHELGHFLAAKACGVYVEDFSLGMGPRLLKIQGKETQYTLRAFPIGGWCKMTGEDEEDSSPRAFCNKKPWQRIIIVAAGPLMNFLFAILVFVVLYAGIGLPADVNRVGSVVPETPAAIAGLEKGDIILEINGTSIESWTDISTTIAAQEPGSTLQILIDRNGSRQTLLATPYFNEEYQMWQLGIQASRERQNVFVSISLGVKESIFFTKELLLALFQMITGQTRVEVSGPVGIVTIINDATQAGITYLLLITAYLCLNLGVINLFPLPALDGSRIVFLVIEWIRGKPIDRKKEGMVHFVGLILLMALMVVITFNDVIKLVAS